MRSAVNREVVGSSPTPGVNLRTTGDSSRRNLLPDKGLKSPMRRIITLSAVAALIAPASAVARKHHPVAHHKVPPPLCAPDTSPYKSRSMPYRRTLASGALAQVYSVGAAPPRLVGLQNGDRPIYGCVYGHRGAWRLGAEPFDDGGKYMNLDIYGDRNVTLAGTFVA